jgi:DDE superfamily endonuclease
LVQKNDPRLIQAICQGQAPRPVEAWPMDAQRIGLKPIIRRVWAKRGQRPIGRVYPRYQWLSVYSFVQPSTGHSFWLLMPTVSVAAFTAALTAFAECVGAGPDKLVILLVDRAGWPTSPHVQPPAELWLHFLPAYSPELQPAEHLWALSAAPLVNQPFDGLYPLEAVQAQRCTDLQDQPDLIRSTTTCHWWPHCA